MSKPLFPFDSPHLDAQLSELDVWKRALDQKFTMARTWNGRLRRDLEVEAVAASTIMEGVNVTVDEVRRILAGEKPDTVSEEDHRLVTGYRNAMTFVVRQADNLTLTWDRGLISNLHYQIAGGAWTFAGRFREAPVFLTNRKSGEVAFEPPLGELVPKLMDRVLARMAEGFQHPAIGAAWLHIATAAVHPFKDGNGRVARVLASLVMYRGGFERPEFTSLEEWWGRHVDDYYAAFDSLGRHFREDADVTPFISAHVGAQLSQVRALDLREEVERRIWSALEEMAEAAGQPRRLANAAWEGLFERSLTAGAYRNITDVGETVATQDLTTAVALGWLRSEGERRWRRYLLGPNLMPAIGKSLDVDLGELEPAAARAKLGTTLSARVVEAGTRLAQLRGNPPAARGVDL
jgi:Fic family protein